MMRTKFLSKFLASLAIIVGNVLPTSAAVYNAKSVIVNIGMWSSHDYAYTLLGENNDNRQIWGWIKSTEDYAYAYWKIDNGKKLSRSENFYRNYNHPINDNYSGFYARFVGVKTNESYFLKVNSQTSANVIYCVIGTDISSQASDFYVTGSINADVYTATFDGSEYSQKISYNVNGPTNALFKNVVVEQSFDGGSTWTAQGTYTSASGSITASLPWDKTQVRYRFTAYPQDCYRSVVKGGSWTYTTGDFALNPSGISCSIDKIPTADELKNSYNAESGTFNPEITWSTSANMTKAFESASLYYSYDKGTSWKLAETVKSASGKTSISVAPGYTSYMFRITETPCEALSKLDKFKPSATVQGPEVSYNPAVDSVTLSSKVSNGYNATDKTFSQTVKVAVNTDLYVTMQATDTAYINYTTDNGKTWSENIPVSFNDSIKEATFTVPVKECYQYRFSANSYVNGAATAYTTTSKAYTVSDFYDLDGIGKYDKNAYEPAQIDADGKYHIINAGNLLNTIGKANTGELPNDAACYMTDLIIIPYDSNIIMPTIENQSFAGTFNGNGKVLSGVLKNDASIFGGHVTAKDLTIQGQFKISHETPTGTVTQEPNFTAHANGTNKFDYHLGEYRFEDMANAISMPIDQSSVVVKHIYYTRSAEYVKQYMPVCLPFDFTTNILPGSESKIYKFDKFYKKGDVGHVHFIQTNDTIPAGTPVIVKTDECGVGSDWELHLVAENSNRTKLRLSPIEPTETSALVGALETKTIGEGYYMLNDDGTNLTKTTASSQIHPFRAYLALADAENVTTFVIHFDDDTSGIGTIGTDSLSDNSPVDIYDLAGNLVARKMTISEATSILHNGIYIAGGKKIVINK